MPAFALPEQLLSVVDVEEQKEGGGEEEEEGGKKSLFKNTSESFFCSFFLVCKLVLEPGMCSGRFVVLAYSFFMSSRWLNTRKSTQLLFRMNSWSVRNRPIKATCHSFFSAVCSNFTPDFWNNAGNSAVEALL